MAEITKRAMEINRWDFEKEKTIRYRVACSCGSPECDLDLTMTFHKEDKDLDLTFCRKVRYYYYPNIEETKLEMKIEDLRRFIGYETLFSNFLYEIKYKIYQVVSLSRRLRDAYKMIFYKEISLEGGLIIDGKEHIITLIKTLIEGLNYVDPGKYYYLGIPDGYYNSSYARKISNGELNNE
jgi:hypothetical protein